MSIKNCIGGVIKDVSDVRTGVGGVVKPIYKGICGIGGVNKVFFLSSLASTIIDHFEIKGIRISMKNITYSGSAASKWYTQNKPTQEGATSENLDEYAVFLWSKASGYDYCKIKILAHKGVSIRLYGNIYVVYKDDSSETIDQLFNSGKSVIISGTQSMEKNGTGTSVNSKYIIYNSIPSTSNWSFSSIGSSGDTSYSLYFDAVGNNNTKDQTVTLNMDISPIVVDGISYPIRFVF